MGKMGLFNGEKGCGQSSPCMESQAMTGVQTTTGMQEARKSRSFLARGFS